MSHPALDRLVSARQLKAEPRNDAETQRMLALARSRLRDAGLGAVSVEGRFTSAYNVAHTTVLAALRWHGYRSENRYIVFQCLTHAFGWPAQRWRVLDVAHRKRNLAEYEGNLEVERSTIDELSALVSELISDVEALIGQRAGGS
ncbi:MAG: hypothetical protein JSU95_14555 [Betaproteobacteria bacterium]|nr:MAG: hypothetical protein JSU95_14555 [Betaproteobacteria bacterium]